MKTQKIFLLAAVIVLVLLTAVACDSASKKTEAPNCFVFEDDVKFDKIDQLEGKVVASNADFDVVALETETFNTSTGKLDKTIKVYDLHTNRIVYQTSHRGEDSDRSVEIKLNNYPLIQVVTRQKDSSDEFGDTYSTSSTFVIPDLDSSSPNSTNFHSGNVNGDSVQRGFVGNMYLYVIDDTLLWVNKVGDVVRTQPVDVSDSYTSVENMASFFGIDAEYNGYLYTYEYSQISQSVLVYDRDGVCISRYDFPKNTVTTGGDTNYNFSIINPRAFVLDNGNVLVQSFVKADENAETWDVTYADQRLVNTTVILNYLTGEVTEIDTNYVVLELESAYDRLSNNNTAFAFELAGGYNNQALMVEFENGYFTDKVLYNVVDNELNVKYTLPNERLQLTTDNYYLLDVDSTGYIADVYENGDFVRCKFDYNGNIIGRIGENYTGITGNYYTTPNGVYTMGGELKFDFAEKGFDTAIQLGRDDICHILNGGIYLLKYNFTTGGTEIHALNTDTWTTTVVADGVDVQISGTGDGYFKVYDRETDVSSLYNSANEVILKVRGSMNLVSMDSLVYVTVRVDGQDLVYVINESQK